MLGEARTKIQPMEYRSVLVTGAGGCRSGGQAEALGRELPAPDRKEVEATLRQMREEHEQERKDFQREFIAAREEAFEAGRKSVEDQHSATLASASEGLTKAIEEFRLTRDHYLLRVEREIVQLSLAIAERILHREAQIDPLLLSGAVRVALGQLAESTEVCIRVPLGEEEMWTEMFRFMPNLPLRPTLKTDERMKAGECTIETHLGSVDIGVRAQLAEIERGFFDLLQHREYGTSDPQPG